MLISRAILPPKTYELQITSSKYTSSTPTSIVLKFIGVFELWRRGWDSNPRYGFPYARFRGEYFQPLSHLSAVVADLIVAEQSIFRQLDNHPTGQGGAGGLEPFTTPAKSPRKKSRR